MTPRAEAAESAPFDGVSNEVVERARANPGVDYLLRHASLPTRQALYRGFRYLEGSYGVGRVPTVPAQMAMDVRDHFRQIPELADPLCLGYDVAAATHVLFEDPKFVPDVVTLFEAVSAAETSGRGADQQTDRVIRYFDQVEPASPGVSWLLAEFEDDWYAQQTVLATHDWLSRGSCPPIDADHMQAVWEHAQRTGADQIWEKHLKKDKATKKFLRSVPKRHRPIAVCLLEASWEIETKASRPASAEQLEHYRALLAPAESAAA